MPHGSEGPQTSGPTIQHGQQSARTEPQLTCMREDVVGEAAKSVVADGGHAKQGELNQAPLGGLGVPLHVRHTLRHFARCLKTVRSPTRQKSQNCDLREFLPST